jgi:hypothetical protein
MVLTRKKSVGNMSARNIIIILLFTIHAGYIYGFMRSRKNLDSRYGWGLMFYIILISLYTLVVSFHNVLNIILGIITILGILTTISILGPIFEKLINWMGKNNNLTKQKDE